MSENLGVIEYQVRSDLSGVIRSTTLFDRNLEAMERSFGRVDAAASTFNGTLGRLTTVAYSVGAALAVDKIVKYADAWTIAGNKIANYLKDGQNLADVQESIFQAANRTSTPLQAVASLYGRLEPATRGLISSGSELLKITETINKAFVVSGATAEEASNAVVQLAQALGAGALRSEEFNSVNEQGPRIMQGIADYMGVARGELKNLAAQGKITTAVVIESMRAMSDSVDSEFSKMNQTFEMKGTQALNNLTKALGSNDDVKKAVSAIGDAMLSLSENIDSVVTAGEVLATIYGAKLIGAISSAAVATAKSAIASHSAAMAAVEETKAEVALATANMETARVRVLNQKATISQIAAERDHLASAQASLTAQLSAATTERDRTAIRLQLLKYSQAMITAANQEAAAVSRLAVVTGEASAAQRILSASTETAAATARAASASLSAASGVLGLIGGPAGLATIAAIGVYSLYQNMEEGRKSSIEYGKSLDANTEALKKLTAAQAAAQVAQLERSITEQTKALKEQREAVTELQNKVAEVEEFTKTAITTRVRMADAERKLTRFRQDLAIATGDLETKETELSQTKSKLYSIQQQQNGSLRDNYVMMGDVNSQSNIAAGIQRELNNIIGEGNRLLAERNNVGRQNYVMTPDTKISQEAQNILADIKARTEAEKAYGTAASARIMAEKQAADAGVTDPAEIRQISDAAAAYWELTNSRKEGTKAAKSSATEEKRISDTIEEAKLKTQQLAIQYKNMSTTELGAIETKKRHTQASAELEAQRTLGISASSQQVKALAAEIYAQDQLAAKLDARVNRQKVMDEALKTSAEQAQKNRDLQSKVDPIAAVKINYEDQLAALQEAKQRELITEQQFQQQKEILARTYEQNRMAAAEELYKQQSAGNEFLMNSLDALGSAATSTISGLLSGTMSVTEAMQNFANIILNQAVGALVEMGLNYVKQQLLSQAMAAAQVATASATGTAIAAAYAPAAAMASLASFGGNAAPASAGIASTTALASSLALAGGRRYGGAVNPGSMYPVNEGGAPEMLTVGAKQYLMPNARGEVVSNSDATGGSGGWTIINNNYASDVVSSSVSVDESSKTITMAVNEVARQLSTRTGPVSKGLQGGYNVSGRTS